MTGRKIVPEHAPFKRPVPEDHEQPKDPLSDKDQSMDEGLDRLWCAGGGGHASRKGGGPTPMRGAGGMSPARGVFVDLVKHLMGGEVLPSGPVTKACRDISTEETVSIPPTQASGIQIAMGSAIQFQINTPPQSVQVAMSEQTDQRTQNGTYID